MSENNYNAIPKFEIDTAAILAKNIFTYVVHILLFILTFFTTTLAGVQWLNRSPFELTNFSQGLKYSIPILLILSSHEFGHYFAARYYRVQTTLPYFIPVPPFLINPFGTMGAVIRIRSPLTSKKTLFDVGIAGPLAGLIVTLIILLYGLNTLPGKEYIYSIHPEYQLTDSIPNTGLTFGYSFFYWTLTKIFSSNQTFIPPMNEVYHYPYLCAGWFGLFVTALNLIPVGQLDGGHILYAMIGKRQGTIAKIFFLTLIALGLCSLIPILGWNIHLGTIGWLIWAAILFFIIKLDHPEINDDSSLDTSRLILGWITFALFIIIFTPIPIFEQ